jgi:hypothetical protein
MNLNNIDIPTLFDDDDDDDDNITLKYLINQLIKKLLNDNIKSLQKKLKTLYSLTGWKIPISSLVGVTIFFIYKLVVKYGLSEGLLKYKNWTKQLKNPTTIKDLKNDFNKKHNDEFEFNNIPPELSDTMIITVKFINDLGQPINYVDLNRLKQLWNIIYSIIILSGDNKIPKLQHGELQKKVYIKHLDDVDIITNLVNELKKQRFIPSGTPKKGPLSKINFIEFKVSLIEKKHKKKRIDVNKPKTLQPELIITVIN